MSGWLCTWEKSRLFIRSPAVASLRPREGRLKFCSAKRNTDENSSIVWSACRLAALFFANLGYLHSKCHACLYEMAKTASIYRKTSCLYWLICIFSTNLVAQFLIFYLYHRKKKVTILTSIEIRGWAVMRLDLSFSFCLARACSTRPSCNCQGVGKTNRCESATQA